MLYEIIDDDADSGTSREDLVEEDNGPVHVHRHRGDGGRRGKEVLWREPEEGIDAEADAKAEIAMAAVTIDKAMSAVLEAVAAAGINSDSRTRGSGEDSNHPTDEAGPKPEMNLNSIFDEGDSERFIESIFDKRVVVTAGHKTSVSKQIASAVRDGKLSKKRAKELKRLLVMLKDEYVTAEANGESVEVWARQVATETSEFDGFECVCPFDADEKDEGLMGEGKWLRIRNGITMDSGSSVFVVPSGWLKMFVMKESEGSRKGQTYRAASKDGKPIHNEGEKEIKFCLSNGAKRKMVCQVAKVNKILASMGQICDQGNEVIFREDGGEIVHIATGRRTPFRRHGNVYVMDAWVRNPNWSGEEKDEEDSGHVLGFARPSDAR